MTAIFAIVAASVFIATLMLHDSAAVVTAVISDVVSFDYLGM